MTWLVEVAGSRLNLFLSEVSLKAAVVLLAACGISLILSLRRSSAAARHLMWCLAIGGVLGLPLLAAALPPWNIRVPGYSPTPLPSLSANALQMHANSATELLALTPTAEETQAPIHESELPAALSIDPEISTAAPSKSSSGHSGLWILWAWITGATLALVPTSVGIASLWALGRRSHRVTSGRLLQALKQGVSQLGIKSSVRLLQSQSRSMPMTWGFWRPTILLPAAADRWSTDRLRVVLLHELAHVQRGDCATQLLAQVARAVYWFNPLAWLAERQLRIEQEQACDDLVLRSGFQAPDYAEHLLAVSANCQLPVGAAGVALAMARTSKIERRLLSILNPRQNRSPLSRHRVGFVALTAIATLSLLSVLDVEVVAQAQPGKQSIAQNAQAADPALRLAELRARIAEQNLTPVDENEIVQGAIKGIIGALRDPHADYLTPEMVAETEKQIGGTRVGIGVQLEIHERQIRVVTALPESPALRAGIQPGDIILHIDGQPTAGVELPDVVKRIAGPQGTPVRLKIGRDAAELEIAVTRGPIKIATVKGFRRGPDNQWSYVLDARQTIGYAQITQFGTATPQELQAALQPLKQQGLKGLILDLRFCPGGTLDSAVGVAKLFLAGGTVVSLHGRGAGPVTMTADAASALGDFPLIVLVNGQTASAAEVVAGALQDNRRAVVLGTRTVGKGSVQSLIKLAEGNGAIKLTTSTYRLPSGRNIDKRPEQSSWGIDPDAGYFVPLDRSQQKTLLARRQERDILGGKSADQARQSAEVTAAWIEEQQGDPQLAAALKAMTARLAMGQFATVSEFNAAQIEKFVKQEDVEQRREVALQKLQEVDRELFDLRK